MWHGELGVGCVGYVVFVLVLRRLQGMVEKGPFAALPNYPLTILLLFVLLSSFMPKFLRIILISLAGRLANLLE